VGKAKHKTIKHTENAKLEGGTPGVPGVGRFGFPVGDGGDFSGRAGEGDGVGEVNGDGVGEGDEKSSGDTRRGRVFATGAGKLDDSSTHASTPRFTNLIMLALIPIIQ
jgi:hypothetical protein